MKKTLTVIGFILIALVGHTQGDCFNSATNITTCGYIFAGNNNGFGSCAGDKCGCVGGGSNPSNLDNDCSTTYPGGNCGSDFQGSVENSMFWKFRPTESCDFQLCLTADNCCCAQGAGADFMQVWIGQQDTTTGLISAYHVNDNSNTSITGGNTICYTFTVDTDDGDLVIMVDGNAGSECDIYLDLNQVNCTDTCPIVTVDPVMSIKLLSFKVKNTDNSNIISWKVSDQSTQYYNIEKSKDGKKFSVISSINANSESRATYSYSDNSINTSGYSYYRLKEVGLDGVVSYSSVRSVFNDFNIGKIIDRYDLMGTKVDSTYKGIVIEKYESGIFKKKVY